MKPWPISQNENCSRCNSSDVKKVGVGRFASGQCIGICQNCGQNFVIENRQYHHGGKREGAGRKPAPWPTQLIKIKCTDEELAEIHKLTTRERAVAMLNRTHPAPQPVSGVGERGE